MKKSLVLLFLLSVALSYSCRKEVFDTIASSDSETGVSNPTGPSLYELSSNDSGYTYFDSGKLLTGKSPSPHGSFKLRFNSIAQAALDENGNLPKDNLFPEGSIIVKEIFSGADIRQLAVMQKKAGDPNIAEGWVWVEYSPTGSEDYGVSMKGAACTGCHSESPHRDLVRTFDLH